MTSGFDPRPKDASDRILTFLGDFWDPKLKIHHQIHILTTSS